MSTWPVACSSVTHLSMQRHYRYSLINLAITLITHLQPRFAGNLEDIIPLESLTLLSSFYHFHHSPQAKICWESGRHYHPLPPRWSSSWSLCRCSRGGCGCSRARNKSMENIDINNNDVNINQDIQGDNQDGVEAEN